jgi:CubicO group peptidase (beta-lactamase class C family)
MTRSRHCRWLFAVGLLLASAPRGTAWEQPDEQAAGARQMAVFRRDNLEQIDTTITQAIADKKLPGGVFWLERQGAAYHRAYGRRSVAPTEEAMTEDTIFDAASLTKVLATTPAVMLLMEQGKLKLDATIQTYISEFDGQGKEEITLRELLTHTSGLPPGLSRSPPWSGRQKALELACAQSPATPPGTAFHYSDIGFIVLGELVVRVSGWPLEEFVQRKVYQPLKMVDTGFTVPPPNLDRVAPTERLPEGMLRGKVHDPTARLMGGVAGHAGLFTTAADLARFARMLLNGGQLDGVRILAPETVKLMTSVQSPAGISARRGLGWDIDSPYSSPRGQHFGMSSYGHTGWTGTSIWIDPDSQAFVIFLSNRNHPAGGGDVVGLRSALGTLAAEALVGVSFTNTAGVLPARPAGEHTRTSGQTAP